MPAVKCECGQDNDIKMPRMIGGAFTCVTCGLRQFINPDDYRGSEFDSTSPNPLETRRL